MAVGHVFSGVAVADYGTARVWYERLFGRSPDLVPKEDEAAWRLTETAWIYVVRDAEHAGNALLTILVDDLDEHVALLAERGIVAGAIETAPGVFRKAVYVDLEGNTITFAETLGAPSYALGGEPEPEASRSACDLRRAAVFL